ncbi:breast carcinoma-amplified sequence 1 isoform X13 [Gadus morhua]|uniref:breast carcinoma-amplified sequence 1 isoform X13 n=1 Tax=Gadus morhua TaxID=8049 RepID=UPI0011B38BA0|nr:SH3 domain-containing protein 21-like isoform X13 [Gadus morhua]
MGNENSKKKGPMKDGKNGEKHLNGKVNSLKVKNKSDQNGATIEKAEKPNGELTTNTKNKESIVETDGFNVEAPVNGSKDIPGISTEAQVISPKKVPTIQKQQTDEAKGVLKDDEEAPSSQQPEQADTAKNQDSETLEEPKSVTLDLKLAAGQTDNDDQKSQPEEKKEESDQNPVMNFFKTLVTPTKSQKKETATPDVTKDQPPKETPPTVASTTVAQVPEPPAAAKGMSIPPPPPPEPPKMEIKGGLAAQQQKPTPKEGAKASAKQPDAAKGKSAKETLSSFFRSKEIQEVLQQVDQVQDTVPDEPEPVLEVKETAECLPQPVVEVQTVEEVVPEPVVVEVEKADASKTTTLEADVKPQAAAPLPDDKKPAAKSPFFSFFKPKSQKRNSLDAGVQTESAAAAPASEKTK